VSGDGEGGALFPVHCHLLQTVGMKRNDERGGDGNTVRTWEKKVARTKASVRCLIPGMLLKTVKISGELSTRIGTEQSV